MSDDPLADVERDDDGYARLLTDVIRRLLLSASQRDTLIGQLRDKADAGDVAAAARLRNPWSSSTPPSRKIPELRAQRGLVLKRLGEIGPELLADMVALHVIDDHLTAYRDAVEARQAGRTVERVTGEGFERLVSVMREEGVSSRDAQRASRSVIREAARLIRRSTDLRVADDVATFEEIRRAGHAVRVCYRTGWHPDRPSHMPGTGYASPMTTVLPEAVEIDPPGLPRRWVSGQGQPVPYNLWEALPADPFYRSFFREVEADEFPPILTDAARKDGDDGMPVFEDLATMIGEDDLFAEAYETADRTARKLDGIRAHRYDALAAEIGEEGGSRHLVSASLDRIKAWLRPVGMAPFFDTPMWDAWRPWGTLFAALDGYLSVRGFHDGGCHVRTWAYLLHARHLRSEQEFPAFVREAVFDWCAISSGAPGQVLRYLVPRTLSPPIGEREV